MELFYLFLTLTGLVALADLYGFIAKMMERDPKIHSFKKEEIQREVPHWEIREMMNIKEDTIIKGKRPGIQRGDLISITCVFESYMTKKPEELIINVPVNRIEYAEDNETFTAYGNYCRTVRQ